MVTLSPYYRAAAEHKNIDISVELYESHYTEEGWLARKALAVPGFVIAIVIKTTYHVAMAVIVGVPKFLDRDSKRFEAEVCNAARDVEEAFACIFVIFNDKRGSYHRDRSQFFKEKNIIWAVENEPFSEPPTIPTPQVKAPSPSPEKSPLFQLDPNASPLTSHYPLLSPFIPRSSSSLPHTPTRTFYQLDPNATPLTTNHPLLDPFIEPAFQIHITSPGPNTSSRTPPRSGRFPPSSYLTPVASRSHLPHSPHRTRPTPEVIKLIRQVREYHSPSRMPPTLRKQYAQHLMRELAKVNKTLHTPIRLANNLGFRSPAVLPTPLVAPAKKSSGPPTPPPLNVANVEHKDAPPQRPPSLLTAIQGFKLNQLTKTELQDKPLDVRSGVLEGIKGFDKNTRLTRPKPKPKPKITPQNTSSNPLSEILARRAAIGSPSSPTTRRAAGHGATLMQALQSQAALLKKTVAVLQGAEDSESDDEDWSDSPKKTPVAQTRPPLRRHNSDSGTPQRPAMFNTLLQDIRSHKQNTPEQQDGSSLPPKGHRRRNSDPGTPKRSAMPNALLQAIQLKTTGARLNTSVHQHRASPRKAAPKKTLTMQEELAMRAQRRRSASLPKVVVTPTASPTEKEEEEDLSGLTKIQLLQRQLGMK